ncbi:hypothetical protein ACTWPB_06035 [Nocardia sp. IBHARD005]|uniref:hypothetical protein n=1 Tax=Nocardia sp. IBHARD005 TaxID=3457765 RepID=UPI004058C531
MPTNAKSNRLESLAFPQVTATTLLRVRAERSPSNFTSDGGDLLATDRHTRDIVDPLHAFYLAT